MESLKSLYVQLIFLSLMYIGLCIMINIPRNSEPVQVQDAADIEVESEFEYSSTYILEVPNHMAESHYEGYTKVFGDEETDRAVYVKNDYKPQVALPVNADVKMGDVDATVNYIDSNGFSINIPVLAKHGMSGTLVTYKDVPIGFVSKAEGLYDIYCVFL